MPLPLPVFFNEVHMQVVIKGRHREKEPHAAVDIGGRFRVYRTGRQPIQITSSFLEFLKCACFAHITFETFLHKVPYLLIILILDGV